MYVFFNMFTAYSTWVYNEGGVAKLLFWAYVLFKSYHSRERGGLDQNPGIPESVQSGHQWYI